jgi:hypothetical protein
MSSSDAKLELAVRFNSAQRASNLAKSQEEAAAAAAADAAEAEARRERRAAGDAAEAEAELSSHAERARRTATEMAEEAAAARAKATEAGYVASLTAQYVGRRQRRGSINDDMHDADAADTVGVTPNSALARMIHLQPTGYEGSSPDSGPLTAMTYACVEEDSPVARAPRQATAAATPNMQTTQQDDSRPRGPAFNHTDASQRSARHSMHAAGDPQQMTRLQLQATTRMAVEGAQELLARAQHATLEEGAQELLARAQHATLEAAAQRRRGAEGEAAASELAAREWTRQAEQVTIVTRAKFRVADGYTGRVGYY